MARRRFPLNVTDDSGATAAEYAILVSLIAGVIVTAVVTIGTQTAALFATVDWLRL